MSRRDDMDDDRVVVVDQGSAANGIGMLLLGLAIGAGAALLLAPASGQETRQRLQREARRAGRRVKVVAGDLTDDIEDRVKRSKSQFKKRVAHARDSFDDRVDRARDAMHTRTDALGNAIDAGRDAAAFAREELEAAVEKSKRAYAESRRAYREARRNAASRIREVRSVIEDHMPDGIG